MHLMLLNFGKELKNLFRSPFRMIRLSGPHTIEQPSRATTGRVLLQESAVRTERELDAARTALAAADADRAAAEATAARLNARINELVLNEVQSS